MIGWTICLSQSITVCRSHLGEQHKTVFFMDLKPSVCSSLFFQSGNTISDGTDATAAPTPSSWRAGIVVNKHLLPRCHHIEYTPADLLPHRTLISHKRTAWTLTCKKSSSLPRLRTFHCRPQPRIVLLYYLKPRGFSPVSSLFVGWFVCQQDNTKNRNKFLENWLKDVTWAKTEANKGRGCFWDTFSFLFIELLNRQSLNINIKEGITNRIYKFWCRSGDESSNFIIPFYPFL